VKPKKQKPRKMSDENVATAKPEVQRLLDARFIREVQYPSWLANVVIVKKKNIKWRMCTYFTDLNKSCPKDDFLLTRIDKVVDSASGCEIMAVLDWFYEYHQIGVHRVDEEKQALSYLLAPIVILECPKASRMLVPRSA
jgi:hypothetical protein